MCALHHLVQRASVSHLDAATSDAIDRRGTLVTLPSASCILYASDDDEEQSVDRSVGQSVPHPRRRNRRSIASVLDDDDGKARSARSGRILFVTLARSNDRRSAFRSHRKGLPLMCNKRGDCRGLATLMRCPGNHARTPSAARGETLESSTRVSSRLLDRRGRVGSASFEADESSRIGRYVGVWSA